MALLGLVLWGAGCTPRPPDDLLVDQAAPGRLQLHYEAQLEGQAYRAGMSWCCMPGMGAVTVDSMRWHTDSLILTLDNGRRVQSAAPDWRLNVPGTAYQWLDRLPEGKVTDIYLKGTLHAYLSQGGQPLYRYATTALHLPMTDPLVLSGVRLPVVHYQLDPAVGLRSAQTPSSEPWLWLSHIHL